MTRKKRESRHQIPDELLDQLLASYEKPEDLTGEGGILKELTARLLSRALEGEMSDHLGYERGESRPEETTNARNGVRSKTLKTDRGELEIDVPRDREATFEPTLVKKRQVRFSGGFDEKILALYSRGMTVRDIREHLEESYGVEVSLTIVDLERDVRRDGRCARLAKSAARLGLCDRVLGCDRREDPGRRRRPQQVRLPRDRRHDRRDSTAGDALRDLRQKRAPPILEQDVLGDTPFIGQSRARRVCAVRRLGKS